MEKYVTLFIGLIGVFIIGGYATFELYGIKNVEAYRWIITSIVTIGFLIHSITLFKKTNKNG